MAKVTFVGFALPFAAALAIATAVPARADLDSAIRALATGKNIATACKEIISLAEQGDALAMAQLSEAYKSGACGKRDAALAGKWQRRAAEKGDAYAQMTLGSHYRIGDAGYRRDFVQAYKWYDLAATAPKPRSKAGQGEVFSQLMRVQGTASFNDTAADLQAATQRDRLAQKMTPAQITEAKKLADEWRAMRK